MKKILVTGGCGFVGSHLIEHILKNTDWEIVTLDRFDASGNPNRLSDMLEMTEASYKGRVKFVFWDLKAELNDAVIKQLNGPFDYIAHLAAGTHVDRSIGNPLSYFMDNCIGTVNLLNYARQNGLKSNIIWKNGHILPVPEGDKIFGKFLYFSTDEVYGPAPFEMKTGYKEWDRQNPNNPYAAAKSAAEMACISFAHTYKIPVVITNTMNIFGERQAPEKYVPLVINKILKGEKLFVHSDKTKTHAGMRHYLHARNICAATLWILQNGKCLDGSGKQGRYNIVGEIELDNLTFALMIKDIVNDWMQSKVAGRLPLDYEMVDFHSSRPGHDLRYCLDGSHLKEEGFEYPKTFEESLKKTIYWTLDHQDKWL